MTILTMSQKVQHKISSYPDGVFRGVFENENGDAWLNPTEWAAFHLGDKARSEKSKLKRLITLVATSLSVDLSIDGWNLKHLVTAVEYAVNLEIRREGRYVTDQGRNYVTIGPYYNAHVVGYWIEKYYRILTRVFYVTMRASSTMLGRGYWTLLVNSGGWYWASFLSAVHTFASCRNFKCDAIPAYALITTTQNLPKGTRLSLYREHWLANLEYVQRYYPMYASSHCKEEKVEDV